MESSLIIGAVLLAAGITGFAIAFRKLGRITSFHDAAIRNGQVLLGISLTSSSAGFVPLALGVAPMFIS